MGRRTRTTALVVLAIIATACASERSSAPLETLPAAPGLLPDTTGVPVVPAPPAPTAPAPQPVVSIVYVQSMAPSADPGVPAPAPAPVTPVVPVPASTTTTTTVAPSSTTTTTTLAPPTDDELARLALVGLADLPDGWVELARRADDGVAELYGGLADALFRWCMGPGNYEVGPRLEWQATGDIGPDGERFPALRQSVALAGDDATAAAAFDEIAAERFGECTAGAMASVFDYVIADPDQTTYPAGTELGEIEFERRAAPIDDEQVDDAIVWFFRVALSTGDDPDDPATTTTTTTTTVPSGPTTSTTTPGGDVSTTTTTLPEPEPVPQMLIEMWFVREGRALSTVEFRLVQEVTPDDEDAEFLHVEIDRRAQDGAADDDSSDDEDVRSLMDLVAGRLATAVSAALAAG